MVDRTFTTPSANKDLQLYFDMMKGGIGAFLVRDSTRNLAITQAYAFLFVYGNTMNICLATVPHA